MRTMGFWSRSLAGVLGLWFGLVMAAPAILHACPQSLAASVSDASESHAAHGSHSSGAQKNGAPAECRCLGTCAVSTSAVLAPAAAVPLAALTLAPPTSIPSTSGTVLDSRQDHTRPFATAPPARTA